MTPFEHQVTEALRPLFSDETKNYMYDCPLVAPRVAAAIRATCAAYEPYAPDFSDVGEAAALAALRGEEPR